MTNFVISLIRTWIPIAVGFVLSYLAVHFSVVVDDNTKVQLIAALTAVVTAVYYALVHVLEQKFPKFGWLLGYANRPHYVSAVDSDPIKFHAGK